MDLKDSFDYQKLYHKRPGATILAFPDPQEIGQVLLLGKWRFRIVEELSKEEFDRRLGANQRQPGAVTAMAHVSHSKLDMDTARDQPAPDPDCRYFYGAVVLD